MFFLGKYISMVEKHYIPDRDMWLVSLTREHSDGRIYDASEYVSNLNGEPNPEELARALDVINLAHAKRARFITNTPKNNHERLHFERLRGGTLHG